MDASLDIVAAIRARIKAELPGVILSGLVHCEHDHGDVRPTISTAKRISGAIANAIDNVIQEECGTTVMQEMVSASESVGVPTYLTKMTRLREQAKLDRDFINHLKQTLNVAGVRYDARP